MFDIHWGTWSTIAAANIDLERLGIARRLGTSFISARHV
jgi:hypothetical protein